MESKKESIINIVEQYGTKYFTVDGVIAAQTPNIIPNFKKILNDFNMIIEIGTNRGGFSQWLFENKAPTAKFYTYDITSTCRLVNNRPDINFIIGDCFDEKIIKEITNYITNNRTLLLCDGGNKEKEFETYAPLIKSNDVIMLHDYSHDPERFKTAQSINQWTHYPESHYNNIKKSIELNNLIGYYYDEFSNVFWGSFIKQ